MALKVDDLPPSRALGECRPVDSFDMLNRIGEGTYGLVYRAIDKRSSEVVALKKVILHNEQQDGFPLTSVREVAVLKRLRHTHCVELRGMAVGRKRDSVYLVFEYCEHDLASLLEHFNRPFSESEAKTLVLQLLSALEYLHDHYIVHRDVKLSNLLYNNRGQLKLADFGLARTFSRPAKPMTNKVVTLWYRAPELLLGAQRYGPPIDAWAAGCILAELLTYKPLFPSNEELEQLERIFNVLGAPNERIWPGVSSLPLVARGAVNLERYQSRFAMNNLRVKLPSHTVSDNGLDLINSLLTYDPEKRTTTKEAVQHDYFYESPYAKDDGLMPTFPTKHTESGDPKDRRGTASSASPKKLPVAIGKRSLAPGGIETKRPKR